MTLVEYTCELFNCETNDLFIRTRKRNVVDARRVCMTVMRKFTNLTLNKIGAYFCQPHYMVIHHIRAFEDLCITDKDFKAKADLVFNAIKNELVEVPYGKKVESIDYLDEDMKLYAELV